MMVSARKEWVSSSNDMVQLKLVSATRDSEANIAENHFNPTFTYTFFGDEETVYGYKKPVVQLHYACGSLATYLGFNCAARVDGSALMERAQEVIAPIVEKLPKGFTDNYGLFMEWVRRDAATFRPMGEKVHEYTVRGSESTFEIFKCKFTTPGFKAYHERLQLFLLWFIEGATFIDDKDDGWEAMLVFERRNVGGGGPPEYAIVGYSTAYAFFCYPDKKRMRISQFLILKPHQKKGHGSMLYNTIYKDYLSRSEVFDFAVEDPNDEFQMLRDRCDYRNLCEMNAFKGLKAPISADVINNWRIKAKMSKGQAERCCEMILLQSVQKNREEEYKQYRLLVKRRLYRHNEEALANMDEDELKEKLHETYQGVEESYREIIMRSYNNA